MLAPAGSSTVNVYRSEALFSSTASQSKWSPGRDARRRSHENDEKP
ncbi:MAG: hypothetical protein IPN03_05690 [Holophagales bacterium]|nr:hypothetical protein [Holophagales bacterium]